MEFLNAQQVNRYREDGYLVLEAHLPQGIIDQAHAEIARLSAHAEKLVESDELIDVEAEPYA